ncbi:Lactoylglutathione lyase family protein [Micrococcus luteus]|nr:Lactoylglutathione lyase family protein [Micrococcus luteus]
MGAPGARPRGGGWRKTPPPPPPPPAGSPAWIDYTAPDFARQRAFYEALFGWTFTDSGEEFGHYLMITKDGASVGGAMDADQVSQMTGEDPLPAAWTVYLRTQDMDATLTAVRENGGAVLVDAMPVGDLGVMAVAEGPGHEVVGFWQSGTFPGHDLPLTPGTSVWFELLTTRFDESAEFYRAVAGWQPTLMGDDDAPEDTQTVADAEDAAHDSPRYATNHPFDRATAGLCDARAWLPPNTVGYWRVYFAVADTDRALEVIREHGGTVLDGPQDSPFGRVTTVLDPAGATFQINEPPAEG